MRGKKAKIRQPQKYSRYGSALIARLINKVMQDGKKSTAEKSVYAALEAASKEVDMQPDAFLNLIVDKLRPALEIKSRRVGGANYSVPQPVTPARQEALSIRWLVDYARAKSGNTFESILKKELADTFKGEGDAMKKKIDVERMAEANKAFAHFRW